MVCRRVWDTHQEGYVTFLVGIEPMTWWCAAVVVTTAATPAHTLPYAPTPMTYTHTHTHARTHAHTHFYSLYTHASNSLHTLTPR